MQPNVFSSAPSSSPAIALKASKQMGPAYNDSRRADSADKPPKSEFAKMVVNKDKPVETRAPEKDTDTQAVKSGKVDGTASAETDEAAKTAASADHAGAAQIVEEEATTGDTETTANTEAAAEVAVIADQVETVAASGSPVAAAAGKADAAATVAAAAVDAASADGEEQATATGADKSAATGANAQSVNAGSEASAATPVPGADSAQAGAGAGAATGSATEAATATPAPLKDPAQETLASAKAGSSEAATVKADEAGGSARVTDRSAASSVAAEDSARSGSAEGVAREGATPDLSRANATATATAALATAAQGVGEQVPQTNVAPVNGPQAVQSSAPVQQLAAAAPQAQVPDAPVQQLAVHVTRAAKEGADRIEIQLKPAELGRVDVKLEVGHDGRVQAVVSAERSDTLDLLRRDVQQLERALTHAGFNTDKDSFSFAERGGERGQQADGRGNGQGDGDLASDDQVAESANDNRRRMAVDRPGVDVKV
ncbi:MAG: flagellar hook-length control protein FliK [Minwuia sp.]|nr:flagellar hook-length control protein FliK [Minwuia sp.]